MRSPLLLTSLAMLLMLPMGCASRARRPPSDLTAIRQPTLWDRLLSDREEERQSISSRLQAEKSSLQGSKGSAMRALRERELDAQLAANDRERAAHEQTIDQLRREVGDTQNELEWVAARQEQNAQDWRYWPDHETYHKPVVAATAPIVEAPTRIPSPQSQVTP
jgi:hypothetical protein